jgi:hypothetical protein
MPLDDDEQRDLELVTMIDLTKAEIAAAINIQKHFVCEIQAHDKFIAAARIAKSFYLISAEGHVYSVDIDEVHKARKKADDEGKYCVVSLAASNLVIGSDRASGIQRVFVHNGQLNAIATSSDGHVEMLRFDAGSNIWFEVASFGQINARDVQIFRDQQVSLAYMSDGKVVVYDPTGRQVQIQLSQFYQPACTLIARPECEPNYKVAGVRGKILDLAVSESTDPTLSGMISINLNQPSERTVHKLITPNRNDRPNAVFRLLTQLNTNGDSDFFVAALHANGWTIWRVAENTKPSDPIDGPEFSRMSPAAAKRKIMIAPLPFLLETLGDGFILSDYGDFVRIVNKRRGAFDTPFYFQRDNGEFVDYGGESIFLGDTLGDRNSAFIINTNETQEAAN